MGLILEGTFPSHLCTDAVTEKCPGFHGLPVPPHKLLSYREDKTKSQWRRRMANTDEETKVNSTQERQTDLRQLVPPNVSKDSKTARNWS